MVDHIMIHPLTEKEEAEHVKQPQITSPEAWYDTHTHDLPPLNNDTPRQIEDRASIAAEIGHEYGYAATLWIIITCALMPLSVLPCGHWQGPVMVGIFFAIGMFLRTHSSKLGLRRLELVQQARLVRAAALGRWTARYRVNKPGERGSELVESHYAAIQFPDEEGHHHRMRMQMRSNVEFDVGDTVLLLHPPGKPLEVRRASDELTAGLCFDEQGELAVDEEALQQAYRMNQYRKLALQVAFALVGLILVTRLILWLV